MYTGQRPLAAILLVLFAIGLASCGSSARPAGPPPAKVKVATMAPKPIEESAIFIAELNSRRSVQLSPIVSGYLKAIAVKAGDQVKAGTLLFHIDSAREEAQLKNLLALREARQASLRLAEANYQRAQQLAPSGVVSEQELQQAATALASARADLAATEAQVSAQQAQVGYYRITAPFDGTLGDIPVKVGDFVNPTTVLTVLSQDGALEPYVRVPLSLAPKLGPDSRIELLDDSGRLLASGKVEFVSPTVDSSTQTVLIKTVIANARALKSSQYVRARVVWGQRHALTVPTTAVSRLSGQYFVYVVVRDPQKGGTFAQQRVVQLGDIIGNDYVVQDGLKEGDQVVISGTQKVANGVPVQLET
jgi:RND family efflux transporter MFP subunit